MASATISAITRPVRPPSNEPTSNTSALSPPSSSAVFSPFIDLCTSGPFLPRAVQRATARSCSGTRIAAALLRHGLQHMDAGASGDRADEREPGAVQERAVLRQGA